MGNLSTLLSLVDISKRFGRVLVADRLALEIGDGEAVGIVGPNGAGKTTLFSIISGDLRPDGGQVVFDGRPVTRLGPAERCRLGIGRTYQVPRPFEHMTVFENVLVAVEQGGGGGAGPAARRRALGTLDYTGLLEAANTPAGRLTLLARKRLEMARALATSPRLLLLDEVAGGLTDPEVDELLAVVAALRGLGLTIVWIEHVVHALTRGVDRLLCLAGGAFIADGRPDEVLATDAVREVYFGIEPELTGAGEEP
jgi:branched-chain amino acid transport system ATP-binding protein